MLKVRKVGIAGMVFVLMANVAAAQSNAQGSGRDSLWNGTLIGLGAGVGSAAALDAVFCDNGFGGCDFPWAAYLTLGGIGAGAGAGIDFLIGDGNSRGRRTTLRLSPIVSRTRRGVVGSLVLPHPDSLPAMSNARQRSEGGTRRDSIWNGTLIGAGIGVAGGALWGRQVCGSNDDECFAIAGPAGMITGAGIGAGIGALADWLHN